MFAVVRINTVRRHNDFPISLIGVDSRRPDTGMGVDSGENKYIRLQGMKRVIEISLEKCTVPLLQNDLEDLLQGKQVRQGITIETAVREWWRFREKRGLGNIKAKLMGQKLIDWCQENDMLLITAFSEWLSQGARPEDVAAYVGTSPKEIRDTYHHWIKENEDRLDEVQRQAWLKQGLDENGNERRKRAQ